MKIFIKVLLLGFVAPSFATSRHISCPFNLLCTCRIEDNTNDQDAEVESDKKHEGTELNTEGATTEEPIFAAEDPTPLLYKQDSIRDVSCVGVQLAKIPYLPDGRIDHVDIISSGLEVVDSFRLLSSNDSTDPQRIQVVSLRFMSNKIRMIGSDAFEPLADDLISLDLSYNELDELPVKALRNLRVLDWANFHSNQIATLDNSGQAWSHLTRTLTALFLGNNQLTVLPRGGDRKNEAHHDSLSQLRRLEWLNLDGNQLAEIHQDSVPSKLHTFSIAHNRLSLFPMSSIEHLKDLRWLDLRGNLITELPSTFHRNSRIRLEKLDLGENILTRLPEDTFNRSITVRDLHLDHNCLELIPANAFRGLNTARLYLASNSISQIDDKAFHGSGGNIILLDLERNNLKEIPKALTHLKKLRFLYLGNNEISIVEPEAINAFSGSLEALSLSGNQLESIPTSILTHCKKLIHLNLDYNQISSIERDHFKEWAESLDTLIMRGNRISKLHSNLFMHTRKLREFSIAFNRISDIHEDAFVNVADTLETLDASFAFQKPVFPDKSLRHLISLQWLSLDNNDFRHIPAHALSNLTALRYISLEWNRFESLPKGLFSSSAHRFLRDIRLSDNQLEHVASKTFQNLAELQTIILSNNRLHTIHTQALHALPRAITVLMSNNRLSRIEPGAFAELPSLLKLDLQINKLREFSLDTLVNVSQPSMPLALNLSENSLVSLIPSAKRSLFHIKTLDLSYNRISEMPPAFLFQIGESLRKLFLPYNKIQRLEENHFRNLRDVQLIHIQHNLLEFVAKTAFSGAVNIQYIDLSWNRLETLPQGAFQGLKDLRVLDLSNNKLKSLSRDILEGTSLETLNLGSNALVALPVSVLSSVGKTLVKLDLGDNLLDHLDAMSFSDFPNLNSLNLSKNKFSLLPDNVFVQLGNLLSLDISHNALTANFKELFHYSLKLKELNMAATELTRWPALPLPYLISLNLSRNNLGQDRPSVIMTLDKLRSLDLSHNRFASVPAFLWTRVPLLRELDLSYNQIKVVNKESFVGLWKLETLNLLNQKGHEEIEGEAFRPLPLLTNLRMPLAIDPPLSVLFHKLSNLRKIYLDAVVPSISSQLVDVASVTAAVRLREIEIRGLPLKYIASDAVSRMGIRSASEFLLSVRETGLKQIPDMFLRGLEKVTVVSLDLRDNQITTLPSLAIQTNATTDGRATRHLSGGLVLNGNPLVCGCEVAWLGPWLRRWQRESLGYNAAILDNTFSVLTVRKPTCIEARSKKKRQLVDSSAAEATCSMLAYSHGKSQRCIAASEVLLLGLILAALTG